MATPSGADKWQINIRRRNWPSRSHERPQHLRRPQRHQLGRLTPKSQTTRPDSGLVEAINQVFALFRLNYHNQYYAAWSDAQQLGQVKRLWLEALGHFSSDLILMGARRAIGGSDYLPTLNRMLASCSEALGELGLPTANAAYEEACLAPSPKAEGTWSHLSPISLGEIRAGIYLQTILAMKLGQRFKSNTTNGSAKHLRERR